MSRLFSVAGYLRLLALWGMEATVDPLVTVAVNKTAFLSSLYSLCSTFIGLLGSLDM